MYGRAWLLRDPLAEFRSLPHSPTMDRTVPFQFIERLFLRVHGFSSNLFESHWSNQWLTQNPAIFCVELETLCVKNLQQFCQPTCRLKARTRCANISIALRFPGL